MGYLKEAELGPSFRPFAAFRENFGFVPGLFRAQTLLPRLIEAEALIAESVLLSERALSRPQKECILLALAGAHRNTYCVTAHYQTLRLLGVPEQKLDRILSDYRQADLTPETTAMLGLAMKLGRNSSSIRREDVTGLLDRGFAAEAVMDAILVTGLANFLCTLSTGLGVTPDFAARPIPEPREPSTPEPSASSGRPGPFLSTVERTPDEFPPFAFFQEKFGFIPNIFLAQATRPDVLEAEAGAVRDILLTEDVLTRRQKECILLVISAANLNTYCVAVHCEILRGLGVSSEESDQIALDHHKSTLSATDRALLDFARKLAIEPQEFGASDVEALRYQRFNDEQILEAVAMSALTSFLNTLQMGLGVAPDFEPRLTFSGDGSKKSFQKMHLSPPPSRHTDVVLPLDPDAEVVFRVQKGDLEAFEELMNRHSQRVYRTLLGILGNAEDARDAMQDTFLKAFQHLAGFEGRSKFSTWLVSIASNTAIQRLRERKQMESLDQGDFESEETFRPRQVQSWAEDPEQLYT